MRYANEISEVMNAFSPEPLKAEQMERFYCGHTMEYRMSDKYSSPMEDIFDGCQGTEDRKAFLLLGHKGCGKSTELNKMAARFEAKGYPVKTVICSMDLDLFNIVYSDLFILMGEALLQIAKECKAKIRQSVLEDIRDFWDDGTVTTIKKRADLALFEENVLEEVIRCTGGSLRDLFHAINTSAKRAQRRNSPVISMEDVQRALEELETSLTRRIEKKDYSFLRNIYEGNKELIEDKEMLLKMLQASVVLEYNGKRWHDLHPLVERFFKEQGLA